MTRHKSLKRVKKSPAAILAARTPEPAGPIEIVDADNRPLAAMSAQEAHRQQLYHRSVFVLVYTMDNKTLLRKRPDDKELYPGCWDVPAAGHVQAEESLRDAAQRCLFSALGLKADHLRPMANLPAGPSTGNEFVTVFSTGRIAHLPSLNHENGLDSYWYDQSEVACLIKEFRDLLTPRLVFFWEMNLLFPETE